MKRFEQVLEIVAVAFSLLYTLLYLDENSWCFLFGGIGATLFTYLCWVRKIYAESFLQLFYVAFAIYGFLNAGTEWKVTQWHWSEHIPFLGAGVILLGGIGVYLSRNTESKMPYLDAFTTVFSLIATYIMVSFVHDNWLYWIIIDAVSIYLYFKRKLYFGSILFFIYFLLSIKGYFEL